MRGFEPGDIRAVTQQGQDERFLSMFGVKGCGVGSPVVPDPQHPTCAACGASVSFFWGHGTGRAASLVGDAAAARGEGTGAGPRRGAWRGGGHRSAALHGDTASLLGSPRSPAVPGRWRWLLWDQQPRAWSCGAASPLGFFIFVCPPHPTPSTPQWGEAALCVSTAASSPCLLSPRQRPQCNYPLTGP